MSAPDATSGPGARVGPDAPDATSGPGARSGPDAPDATSGPGATIFHVVRREELVWDADGNYHAKSLATEGFAHASYRDKVVESARLYFPADADLVVLEIDPAKLDARIEVAQTPRGPMPHVFGALPRGAVTVRRLSDLEG